MTPTRYTSRAIGWEHTGDGEFPYRASVDGADLVIRVNDFPAEPLYSLLVNGQPEQDLEDWPGSWVRPGMPPGLLRAAAEAQARRGRIDAIVAAAWAAALCELPRGTAATAVAALNLEGTLADAIGYRMLEPPPAGTGRFELIEERGQLAAVRFTVTAGPSRADLDALLGPGRDVPRVHFDRPHPVCYPVTVAGAPYRCDVFAYFAGPPDDGGAAESLLLLRRAAAAPGAV
jgi:hypothetical protein